ncbi:hypothetical protein Tco_0550989 [Tanacetum coccineum]
MLKNHLVCQGFTIVYNASLSVKHVGIESNLARQEKVSRMIKSLSYDCGVSFLEEVSSDDCSVEETKDLVKESLVSTHAENDGEKEEFDEVEDGSGRIEAKLRPNTSLFCRRRNREMEAH